MPLPASMICLTASGASSGGSATPFPKATALSTALLPPLAGFLPRTAAEAARVGFASVPDSPGSAAASSARDVAAPATGSTAFAREPLVGSGGSETSSSDLGATRGVLAAATACGARWAFSVAPRAYQPPPSLARPARGGLSADPRLPKKGPPRRFFGGKNSPQ